MAVGLGVGADARQREEQTERDSHLPVLSEMWIWRTVERDPLFLREESLDETPTPLATPTTVETLIRSYDWDSDTAVRVFLGCENPSVDPYAISYTGDYGITQINRVTWEWWLNKRGFVFESEWMLPERNIAMAYAIWLDGSNVLKRSFHHWNCY